MLYGVNLVSFEHAGYNVDMVIRSTAAEKQACLPLWLLRPPAKSPSSTIDLQSYEEPM